MQTKSGIRKYNCLQPTCTRTTQNDTQYCCHHNVQTRQLNKEKNKLKCKKHYQANKQSLLVFYLSNRIVILDPTKTPKQTQSSI